MAEVDGRIDRWWKILHQGNSKMPCEELPFPNSWLCRVAQDSSPRKCALDIALVLTDGTKNPRQVSRILPDYICQRDGAEHLLAICQHVVGAPIDKAVGQLLVESVTPLALEVTLAVQQELQARLDEVDKLRRKQVERAHYEADLAQRRYLHVDPANRLVADSL